MEYSPTQQKILNTAEKLIQQHGYNAFSYKDIAKIVDIKTSSIHYHYPSKENLALAVIDWQLDKFTLVLNNLKIKNNTKAIDKLLFFFDTIITTTYDDQMKMCLGGMFASDTLTLPVTIKTKAQDFFNYLTNWLAKVLAEGIKNDEFTHDIIPEKFAKEIILQIEGALLLARLYEDKSYINNLRKSIITNTGS